MLLVSQPSVIHSKLTKANMNNTCILGLQHVNFLHVCAYLQSILYLIGNSFQVNLKEQGVDVMVKDVSIASNATLVNHVYCTMWYTP